MAASHSARAMAAAPASPPRPGTGPPRRRAAGPRVQPARCHRSRARPETLSRALPEVAALVAFSALPFFGIQALADGPAGKRLAEGLARRKPALEREAAAAEAARRQAAARSPLYGDRRNMAWLGPFGVPDSLAASHLTGAAPADAGFDPLGFAASSSAAFDRYLELELLHGRWAMIGALGAVVPEALTLWGGAAFSEDRWFLVGAAKLRGDDLDYGGVPGLRIAGGQGVAVIALTQALLMSGPELARSTGPAALEPLGIFLPGDQNWPGGRVFDLAGLAANPDAAVRLRVSEAKHGRLAMVAWLGFAAQAAVGGDGPLRDALAALGGGG